jgi:hypothetical protein
MAVDHKALTEWRNNINIQIAFPFLSATDREWLMTGLCAKCQDVMFGPNEADAEIEESINQEEEQARLDAELGQ